MHKRFDICNKWKEFCEISKNTFFHRKTTVTASKWWWLDDGQSRNFSLNWLMIPRSNFLVSLFVDSFRSLDLSWHKVLTSKMSLSFNITINSCQAKKLLKKILCLFGWRLFTRRKTKFSLSPNTFLDWIFPGVLSVSLQLITSDLYNS